MRTIAVVSRKGGAGKTTLALHLAMAAHLRGLSTVLADADPQRSASEVLRGRIDAGPKRCETSGPKLFALKDSSQRFGADLLVIDTPAGPEPDLADAIALADLTLVVVRPTFIDLAAAVRTIESARRLGRAGEIVLNQAYPARGGRETATVRKAIEALRFTNMPVAPVVVRARAVLQTALAAGKSAEEFGPSAAAAEIAALWDHVAAQLGHTAAQLKRA
ncbi:MAG TPA: ParA family protein [Caulobacteraceae bacterium]|jgi:chromosome partitioning protein